MRGEAFAARVQVALDAAFGSGTSSVRFTGVDPEDGANGVFEVEVRPMFGIVFGLKMSMIDESDPAQFEQGAIQVATFAGRGMAGDFLTLAMGLQSATPDMFVLSEAEQALAEVQEIVDEANTQVPDHDELRTAVFEALGAASTCWENLEGAGVFDSTRAKEIGDGLMAKLDAFIEARANELEASTGELREEIDRLNGLIAELEAGGEEE